MQKFGKNKLSHFQLEATVQQTTQLLKTRQFNSLTHETLQSTVNLTLHAYGTANCL
jgi:hypothetical protein